MHDVSADRELASAGRTVSRSRWRAQTDGPCGVLVSRRPFNLWRFCATACLTREEASRPTMPRIPLGELHLVRQPGPSIGRLDPVVELGGERAEDAAHGQSPVGLEGGDFEALLAWPGDAAGLPIPRPHADRPFRDLLRPFDRVVPLGDVLEVGEVREDNLHRALDLHHVREPHAFVPDLRDRSA